MTHLELCSGINGIGLAAERRGFRTVATCEIDDKLRSLAADRYPTAYHAKDIRTLSRTDLESNGVEWPVLISAGFPCQPFSGAGKRRGTNDDRHLWPEVARVLREVRPRWFLGENVRGLLSIDDGRVFAAILGDLSDMGFRVGWGTFGIDEADGSSHRRDRIFIVGYLADAVGWGPRGRDYGNEIRSQREVQTSGRCGELAVAEGMGRAAGIHVPFGTDAGFLGPANCGNDLADPPSGQGFQRIPGSLVEASGIGECIDPAFGDGGGSHGVDLADPVGVRSERFCKGGFGRPDDKEREGGRSFEFEGTRVRMDKYPPGPGLGGHGVIDRIRRLYAVDPVAAWEMYRAELANTFEWVRILSVRPDLAPAISDDEETKLAVRPLANGFSRRLVLQSLGNAVCPDHPGMILDWISALERGELADLGEAV